MEKIDPHNTAESGVVELASKEGKHGLKQRKGKVAMSVGESTHKTKKELLSPEERREKMRLGGLRSAQVRKAKKERKKNIDMIDASLKSLARYNELPDDRVKDFMAKINGLQSELTAYLNTSEIGELEASSQGKTTTEGLLPKIDHDKENDEHSKQQRAQPYGSDRNTIHQEVSAPAERLEQKPNDKIQSATIKTIQDHNRVFSFDQQRSAISYFNMALSQNQLQLEKF